MKNHELRFLNFNDLETRTGDTGDRLIGYASVFNQVAVIYGYFREQVAPGAYADTILEDDIRALWNHDASFVLGRNKAKTLELSEDEKGLKVDILAPDTTWGRDAVTSVKRGDVSQMSIMFTAQKVEWWYPERGSKELPLRTIKKAKLFEVSPVTFPAFTQTSISARSKAQASEILRASMPENISRWRWLQLLRRK